jgi:hypothetical protein
MSEPKRIMQTELGPAGNCQSACLAMMLGCDLAEVPNFAALHPDPNEYKAAMSAWLGARGLFIVTFVRWQGAPWPPRGFYIAGGVSPRGNRHAVIIKDGELWFDPHPDGGGIVAIDDIDLILPLGFRPALQNGPDRRSMMVADIPDEELLRRAVKSALSTYTRKGQYHERWIGVMHAFQLGSTYARELCRRFAIDPDERVRR